MSAPPVVPPLRLQHPYGCASTKIADNTSDGQTPPATNHDVLVTKVDSLVRELTREARLSCDLLHEPPLSPKTNLNELRTLTSSKTVSIKTNKVARLLKAIVKPFITIARKVAYCVQLLLQSRKTASHSLITILDALKARAALSSVQHEELTNLVIRNKAHTALYSLAFYLHYSIESFGRLFRRISTQSGFDAIYSSFLVKELQGASVTQIILNETDKRKISQCSFARTVGAETVHSQLKQLRSIDARKTICSWLFLLPILLGTEMSSETRRLCIEALKNDDVASFSNHLRSYLATIKDSLTPPNALYVEDLLQFFSTPSFETLAQEIHAQFYLKELYESLKSIKKLSQSCSPSSEEEGLMIQGKLATLISHLDHAQKFAATPPICAAYRASQEGSIAKVRRKIEICARSFTSLVKEKAPSKHVLYITPLAGYERKVELLNQQLSSIPTHSFTSTIRHLPDSSKRDNHTSESASKIAQIRQTILRERPDCIYLLSSQKTAAVTTVAKQLGIPLVNMPACFEMTSDWKETVSPAIKTFVPSTQDPIIRSTMPRALHTNAIEEMGLLVGDEFEAEYSQERRSQFRNSLNIRDEEKVVVVSCEESSKKSALIEQLIRKYKDAEHPIHVVAACGNNTSCKRRLDTCIAPKISSKAPVRLSTLETQTKEEEALLLHIADLYIAPPRDHNIFQLYKAGTRTLLDHTHSSAREKLSANIMVSRDRALHLEGSRKLIPLVSKEVQKPRHHPDNIASIKASSRFIHTMSALLSHATSTIEQRRSWYQIQKRAHLSPLA